MAGEVERARALLGRPASIGRIERSILDPRGSLIGAVRVIGVGEEWPRHAGFPMAPVCQINVASLPYRPSALEDLAYVCLYMAIGPGDGSGYALPNSTPNGEGWTVRGYARDQVLAELKDQLTPAPIQRAGILFSKLDVDLPDWDDASDVLDHAGIDIDPDAYDEVGHAAQGIKVGGWPSLVQSEIYWAPANRHPANPAYVVQIDSIPELGLVWGDQGVLYLGRGDAEHRNVWALEWQCY